MVHLVDESTNPFVLPLLGVT
uniref:Uncharacterized protein n=1 Tax=Rhizophora mucronata TaxID=61149 RepID=A0A2P2Q9T9_RHIMU